MISWGGLTFDSGVVRDAKGVPDYYISVFNIVISLYHGLHAIVLEFNISIGRKLIEW